MAPTVGEIAIQVGADITPLVAGLNRGRGEVSKFGSAVDSTASGSMKRFSLAGTLMAGAAVAASLGIATLTKRAIENAGALHDASLATGVHVSTLQAMQQVAGEAGVETEALTASLKRMQNSIAGLIDGTKAQTEAFGKLGLGIGDLQGLNADEQFALIAEAIDGIADPTERTAAAMDIFGKTGANLIPMMEDYRNVLAEVAQHQRETGQAISDTDTANLADLGDSFARLKDNAAGAAMQIAVAFGPAMLAAVDKLATSMLGLNAMFADFKAFLETTPEETNLAAVALTMDELSNASEQAADQAEKLALKYQNLVNGKISSNLQLQAEWLRTINEAFKAGIISEEEYKTKTEEAFAALKSAYEQIQLIDGADMSGAISAMDGYLSAIGRAIGGLTQLKGVQDAVAGATGEPPLRGPAGGFITTPGGLGSSPRPQRPGIDSGVPDLGGGGGGGGGTSTLAADLAALQDSFATEAELLDKQLADNLAKLEEFRSAKLITDQQFNDMELQAKQKHEEAMKAIDDQTTAARLSAIAGAFGDVSGLMSVHNRKLFEIGKAGALGQVIIDGIQATQSAYAKGMAMGGPALAGIFAAAATIKAAASAAAIKSTQYGGGGGGATASGAGGGSSPSAPTQQSIANIYVSGQMLSVDSLEALFDQINAGLKQGRMINLVRQ